MVERALGKIYTVDEAAERLRLTNRGLIKIATRIGACSQTGRNYLFSDADITAIWEECRVAPKETTRDDRAGSASLLSTEKFFELMRSPLPLDGREKDVLRFIRSRARPVTHADVPRAGEKTISKLLSDGYLIRTDDGTSATARVKISEKGRDGLDKYDAWLEKRKKKYPHMRWR